MQYLLFFLQPNFMSLLVVGTVAFDAIETPFGKTDRIVGGAATYISWAASYFTKEINLVSVIGDDFPKEEIELLQRRGINTEGLQIKNGQKSFFWSGKYHLDMNTRTTMLTELNVLVDFVPELPEKYKSSDFLMLGNLTPQVQIRVIEQMKKKPRLIVLDTMNYWMDSQREALDKVLKMIDVLAINDEEARQLSQEFSLIKAARKILRMGPRYLVIKKGENGALLFHEKDVFFAPAIPLEEVYDPTGAGDTFAGGFAGHIAATRDISFDNLKRGIIFGSALASFCVEKFGIERLKNISQDDLDERVREFIDLVQFDISLED